MIVHDSLKGKTYGHKKDNRTEKLEKYQALKDKRYYPMHPQKKNIDEWGAIEKHQHETVQAIERIKNDEKQATKNELKKVYEDHTKFQEKVKEDEKVVKMIEHDVINDVASDAQKEMHRLKLEEKKFQDSLADHYRTEVTRQVAEQRNAKRVQIDEESEKLNIIKAQMTEEIRQKAMERQMLKYERDAILKQKEDYKRYEKQVAQAERNDYKKMMESNAQKEMERELKYKQSMKKKQDMHVNCVNTPEHSKYQKMENWTAQNINQYQSKVNEREKSNDAARKYNLLNMAEYNRRMADSNTMHKERYKKEYFDRAKENLSITKQNIDYEKMLQDKGKEQKELYSNILKSQLYEREEVKKLGTMTDQERRLNKRDLHHFKGYERQIDCMIPGIYNLDSVGSKPLARGFAKTSATPNSQFYSSSQNMLPSYDRVNQSFDVANQRTLEQPSPRSESQNTGNSPKKYSQLANAGYRSHSPNEPPIRSLYQSDPREDLKPTRRGGYSPHRGYNPITNPIPNFKQNPYVNMQRQLVSTYGGHMNRGGGNPLSNAGGAVMGGMPHVNPINAHNAPLSSNNSRPPAGIIKN